MNYSFANLLEEKRARAAVNNKLSDAGRNKYYEGLGTIMYIIDGWLQEEGFTGVEDGIYCGTDGSIHEQVGPHTYLALQWHKMESGRYEINAYLS